MHPPVALECLLALAGAFLLSTAIGHAWAWTGHVPCNLLSAAGHAALPCLQPVPRPDVRLCHGHRPPPRPQAHTSAVAPSIGQIGDSQAGHARAIQPQAMQRPGIHEPQAMLGSGNWRCWPLGCICRCRLYWTRVQTHVHGECFTRMNCCDLCRSRDTLRYFYFMAYIVMAYIVMACRSRDTLRGLWGHRAWPSSDKCALWPNPELLE